MKVTAIIVVYNKDVSKSAIITNIKSYENIELFVVDNSTKANHNLQFCEHNNIRYMSMNGNKGLSKAYNAAIDKLSDTDVVVILDDDTEVPAQYFSKLYEVLEKNPDVDIFVPIVKDQNGIIYSPNNYNFLKNKLVINPMKEVKQESFNAISSCMAIRMRVFDNYRYNEKLFVDEIDHCFCREQRKLNRKFDVIDVEIKQNFHQRSNVISADFAWDRVRMRIIDIFCHAGLIGGCKYKLLAFIKSCGLGVQIGKKSRSIRVIGKTIILSTKLVFSMK